MNNNSYYLVACGGHGRVVADSFIKTGKQLSGIIDPFLLEQSYVFGIKVIGGDEVLDALNPKNSILVNGFGLNIQHNIRKRKYEYWLDKFYTVEGVVHPSVEMGSECLIDISVQIMAGVILQNRTIIGKNTVLNTNCSVDHDCKIGDHVFIAPGAVICGNVSISDEVVVGAGAIILPGLRIGHGSLIGAGTVVTRNIEPYKKVIGKNISDIDDEKLA